jgi:isopenicillin-N epimerase
MARICRGRGTAVLVDGAHVPGNVPFDISAIAADWYVANLHKWYFVPRSCGQPPELTAKALTERIELPLLWSEQEHAVGIS